MENLKALAYELRENVIDMIVEGKAGHIGGDMSVMEILTEIYFDQMNISPLNADDPDRDKFIMSKGHSVEAYYAVLAAKGFFDIKDVIAKFSKFGSKFIGHPNNKLPGIEMNSGSLGHGLPVSVGMALAGKMDDRDYRVYTVMGDGELAEGSVWVYAFSGFCSAIVGIIATSQLVSATPKTGESWEMNAIAASVLGGTSMAGGVGTIGGTIVGAFVIGVINDGMTMCGVTEFWQKIIRGLVIIIAVIIDQVQRNLQAKMALQARNENK